MKKQILETYWKEDNPYKLVEKSSHTVENQKQMYELTRTF